MKLRSARLAQQLRLWIYCLVLILIVIHASSGKVGLIDVLMFMLIGALFYMEICPVCGRLSWWEQSALQKWPNALWIGSQCKHRSEEENSAHSEPIAR